MRHAKGGGRLPELCPTAADGRCAAPSRTRARRAQLPPPRCALLPLDRAFEATRAVHRRRRRGRRGLDGRAARVDGGRRARALARRCGLRLDVRRRRRHERRTASARPSTATRRSRAPAAARSCPPTRVDGSDPSTPRTCAGSDPSTPRTARGQTLQRLGPAERGLTLAALGPREVRRITTGISRASCLLACGLRCPTHGLIVRSQDQPRFGHTRVRPRAASVGIAGWHVPAPRSASEGSDPRGSDPGVSSSPGRPACSS